MADPRFEASSPAASLAAWFDVPDDPVTHRALEALRQRSARSVEEIIDSLAARLREDVMAVQQESPGGHGLPESGTRARRQAAIASECRALAQEMVFASLWHLGDPEWDPLGPATQAPPPGILATLLAT
ncbi:MAG: hypothetical protein E2576_12525 [Alcaligenaceae bacterium]|nr:hypothetical protein [Alcaligenaceae bacterium SAGV5]MPS52346.1 hypothetical protein [Alcaligenaceae bacterium SAGV3]MPT57540.1 hypothetical protein [Alcaligenaceae bacterium]